MFNMFIQFTIMYDINISNIGKLLVNPLLRMGHYGVRMTKISILK